MLGASAKQTLANPRAATISATRPPMLQPTNATSQLPLACSWSEMLMESPALMDSGTGHDAWGNVSTHAW
jgi:hypothetical protein